MSRDGLLPDGVEHWMVDAAGQPAYESETCGTCGASAHVPSFYLNENGVEAAVAYCPVERDYVERFAPACEGWERT